MGKREGLGGSFLQGFVVYRIARMIASTSMIPAASVLFSDMSLSVSTLNSGKGVRSIGNDVTRNQSMDFNAVTKGCGGEQTGRQHRFYKFGYLQCGEPSVTDDR